MITILHKFCSQLSDYRFRLLPFMVIGAVSWAASWLLFPSNVEAKVLNPVVGFVSVHVIDTLTAGQGAAEMFRHNEPVFHDRLLPTLHYPKDWKQFVWNVSASNHTVSVRRQPLSISLLAIDNPSVFAFPDGKKRTWAAEAMKVCSEQFVSYFGCWTFSYYSTPWAFNLPNGDSASFVFGQVGTGKNGWMFSEWGEVGRSRHDVFPVVKLSRCILS